MQFQRCKVPRFVFSWGVANDHQTMVPSLALCLHRLGLVQVQTIPSWHAVTTQSSRNTSAVSRSWATFLHSRGSRIGASSRRGHDGVPIIRSGSLPPAPPPPDFAQSLGWCSYVDLSGSLLFKDLRRILLLLVLPAAAAPPPPPPESCEKDRLARRLASELLHPPPPPVVTGVCSDGVSVRMPGAGDDGDAADAATEERLRHV